MQGIDPINSQADLDALNATEVPPPGMLHMPPAPVAWREMSTRYEEYERAVCDLATAEDNVLELKIRLERARSAILAQTDPKVLGSNEEQRKAAIAARTEFEADQYQRAARSLELQKAEVEVARIRCRMADNTLRYLELQAGIQRRNGEING